MIFTGYLKDIEEAFENTFNKKPSTKDDFNIINISLYSILKSYYFQDNYKYLQIGFNNNGETAISYADNNKFESTKLDGLEPLKYAKNIGKKTLKELKPEDIDINHFPKRFSSQKDFDNKSNLTTLKLNQLPLECKELLNQLKNKKFYNALLEDSDIKKELVIKLKEEYLISVVPQFEIEKFLESKFKEQNLKINEIYDFLKLNYDFRFFAKELISKDERSLLNSVDIDKYSFNKINKNLNNNFYIIAHTAYEIAGIAPVNKNINFANIVKSDDFFNVTSVMVASNARGKGLGVKMFQKAIEEAINRNIFLVRTQSTEQGQNYLKTNIDKLIKEKKAPVIDAEDVNYLYSPILNIFNKNKDKSKIHQSICNLLSEISDFKTKIHESKKDTKSIDEIYDLEDNLKKYMENLGSNKFNKFKLY